MESLKRLPRAKIVGEVYGQATTAVAQAEVSKLLPSLPQIDAVLTQGGGDDYGVVQAFEQAGREAADYRGRGQFQLPEVVVGSSKKEWIQNRFR